MKLEFKGKRLDITYGYFGVTLNKQAKINYEKYRKTVQKNNQE